MPSECYSDHCKATVEEEGGKGIHVEEIWKKECGWLATGTAAKRWRWQHKTELDGNKRSMDYTPQSIRQVTKLP